MDLRSRRTLLAIDLAVIAGCAAFLAHATAGAFDLGPPAAAATAPRATAPRVAAPHVPLERNIFCSTCPARSGAPAAVAADTSARPTTLPLSLVAVVEHARSRRAPRKRVAVVRATDDGSMGSFAVGEKLREATITALDETRVHLQREQSLEYLDLLAPTPPLPANPERDSPRKAPASTERPLASELDRGIKKLAEHSYEVQRTTLESLLGNMNELARSARVMPEVRGGASAGFRVSGVRPDGAFARIGLENGDVVNSLNGLEITSPERALDAYTKLRSASHVSLGIERGGRKITKDYAIR